MASELDLQKLVVDVVNQDLGGFARKLSHRFLIGVPDILVKVPGNPCAVILEVKQQKAPVKLDTIHLDVSVAQARFLRDALKGGVPTGVVSFIQKPGMLGMLCWPTSDFPATGTDFPLLTEDHSWSKIKDRRKLVARMLEFLEGWSY